MKSIIKKRQISKLCNKSNRKTKYIKTLKNNKKSIANKSINIIAYNISWESMTGKRPEWALCSNNTDANHPRHHSVKIGNVASVMEYNSADFILLQEAESHPHLIKQSPRLARMKYELHESSKDKMITFWDKKYKLKQVLRGEFEPGRPWMAILYENGFCVVNVHFGHYSRDEEINKLNQLVKEIKGKINYKRLIIGGDFNYDIKKLGDSGKMILDGTTFYYHPKNLLTCCINRRVQNDHVIDTQAPLLDIKIPRVEYMASDHKPILATLVA